MSNFDLLVQGSVAQAIDAKTKGDYPKAQNVLWRLIARLRCEVHRSQKLELMVLDLLTEAYEAGANYSEAKYLREHRRTISD
jgi:CO dehydrogenase/acetyl-CoA synthase alpha subunit